MGRLRLSTFLCVRLPTVTTALDKWADKQHQTRALARGRQADGTWSTAALKEYPARLCSAMAEALLHRAIQDKHAHDNTCLDDHRRAQVEALVHEHVVPWDPYCPAQTRKHDCVLYN